MCLCGWRVGHHFLSGCFVVTGDVADEHAPRAISALARAMKESDSVAIVRYVYRDNLAPKMGCLIPRTQLALHSWCFRRGRVAQDLGTKIM